MPNLAAYADSIQTPPRTLVEVDIDARDPNTGHEAAALQNDEIPAARATRPRSASCTTSSPTAATWIAYISDFDCHVYYPREVELLFRLTGFRCRGMATVTTRCGGCGRRAGS